MPTNEERRLFAELARKGVAVAPELLNEQTTFVPEPVDPFAGTTSVQPTSDDKHLQPRVDYAGGTSSGRGNPAERSGGQNIPPKVPGASAPGPTQITGSNLPGSTIHQLPPVTQQYPGQVLAVPKSLVPSESLSAYSPSGHGNSADNPPLFPRTASGKNANPGPNDVGDAGVARQVVNPVKEIHRERTWIDDSRPSASRSPLIQNVPSGHQTAGTTLQSPVATPQAQSTEYPRAPGTFNAPTPLPPKSDASDSPGILQPNEFPPGFLTAGQRPKKVVSQIVRDETNEVE